MPPARASRSTAKISIRAQPTGSAAARQMFGISIAGVTIAASSMRVFDRRIAGSAPGTRPRPPTANASKKARHVGEARATSVDMRMCSLRRKATTAPSIASQRNRIEASSSDQTNGLRKT